MTNFFIYIYKILYYSGFNKFNFISLFPLLSIISGSIIILLTISVMDGMEESIFKKMESFHFTYSGDLTENNLFDSQINNLDFYMGMSKKYLISNNDNSKVLSIIALSDFARFKEEHIAPYILEKSSNISGIIIGDGLARELDVLINDKIQIISPLDIDIFSSTIPSAIINISGIFNYNIMDYDYNYAFISSNEMMRIFNTKNNKIFIKLDEDQTIPLNLQKKYNLLSWENNHMEFISALNTEKLLYSSFGYLVILIAAFSSVSLSSLFVVRKTKQLAILRTLGCSDFLIKTIFLFNAIFTAFLGTLIGSFIYFLLILINYKFNFIQYLFFNNLIFDFSINFNFNYIPLMIFISSLFMVFAAIHPVLKILNINLVNTLNNKL